MGLVKESWESRLYTQLCVEVNRQAGAASPFIFLARPQFGLYVSFAKQPDELQLSV